jgi:hypothetical protein
LKQGSVAGKSRANMQEASAQEDRVIVNRINRLMLGAAAIGLVLLF